MKWSTPWGADHTLPDITPAMLRELASAPGRSEVFPYWRPHQSTLDRLIDAGLAEAEEGETPKLTFVGHLIHVALNELKTTTYPEEQA